MYVFKVEFCQNYVFYLFIIIFIACTFDFQNIDK